MAYERFIRRCRNWYAKLLRLYPRPYRDRFGEGMQQTFNDLCRERLQTEKGLFRFTLWIFVETAAGIVRENITFIFITMPLRKMFRVLLVAAGLLIVPLTASFFVDGWNWSPGDYVFAWVMFASTGLGFTFVASKGNTIAYKVAVGLAVAAGFLLVWSNLAVGIIGEDNPANLLYFGVILVGMIGASIGRFQPQVMARSLFAVAVAQMLVPVIALIFWRADFSPGVRGVFTLNAVFAMLWVGSALLFRRASVHRSSKPVTEL